MTFYTKQTSPNEEVNCTEPPPLVSIPYCTPFSAFSPNIKDIKLYQDGSDRCFPGFWTLRDVTHLDAGPGHGRNGFHRRHSDGLLNVVHDPKKVSPDIRKSIENRIERSAPNNVLSKRHNTVVQLFVSSTNKTKT
jgi:hypothetical protein